MSDREITAPPSVHDQKNEGERTGQADHQEQ
jgi:hypothetical protein